MRLNRAGRLGPWSVLAVRHAGAGLALCAGGPGAVPLAVGADRLLQRATTAQRTRA